MNKNKHLKGSTEFCKVNYDLTFIKQNTTNISHTQYEYSGHFQLALLGSLSKRDRNLIVSNDTKIITEKDY